MIPRDFIQSAGEFTGEHPGCDLSDELMDELDASMLHLGRLFATRHGAPEACPLTGPQYMVARALAEAPVRISDVAALLGIKAPAASAMVDNLVNEGLVERTADPDDRRATLLVPTPTGRIAFQQAEDQRRSLLRRYCSVLSEEDIRTMIRIQTTLVDAMSADRI